MRQTLHDLDFACRFFIRNRKTFLAAVLSLGLGMGAATGFFSVVQRVLLEKLPVRDPDRLVLLSWVSDPRVRTGMMTGWMSKTDNGFRTSTSFPFQTYKYLSKHGPGLDSLFAFAALDGLNLEAGRGGQIVRGELVSGNYFSGLGLTASFGRLIQEDDDAEGGGSVVVFSYRLWRDSFGSDPKILGRTVRLNNRPLTVIGIGPPSFEGTLQVGERSDVFVPLAQMKILHFWKEQTMRPDGWWLQVMGRLRPGASRVSTRSSLNILFQLNIQPVIISQNPDLAASDRRLPELRLPAGARGEPEVRKRLEDPLETGAFVVGLLLMIACINTATLLVGLAPTRRHEMAVRLSLGASRARLFRQLLTESLLLACLAGATGLLFAFWNKDLLVGLLARGSQSGMELNVSLNGTVLSFALVASVLVGTLFGLAPALATSSVDPGANLKRSVGTVTRGRVSRLLGRLLVTAQVALVLVVLVSAGLLLATLRNLSSEPLGFEPENLLVFDVDPSLNQYDTSRRQELYGALLTRLRSQPGVRDVSYSLHRLLAGSVDTSRFNIRGAKSDPIYVNRVGPDFFRTMGIPLLLGRGIEAHDLEGPPVIVVSEGFARHFFEGQNPIGQVIESAPGRFAMARPGATQKFEIVGVVGDSKYPTVRHEVEPTVFMVPRKGMSRVSYCIRIAGPAGRMIPQIREAVRGLDAKLALLDFATYQAQARESYDRERRFSELTTLFSLVGLLLAGIGLYGTLSHLVSSRTREFGIRVALGAGSKRIQLLVLSEVGFVGFGLLLGVTGTLGVTRLFQSLVFGVKPTNPWVILAACMILLSTSAAAACLPARRAARVDPVAALRSE